MNKLKRLIWYVLVFGIQALYFPLNRFMQGRLEFKTAFDNQVPLWPVWVVPYGLIMDGESLRRSGPFVAWKNVYTKRFLSPPRS